MKLIQVNPRPDSDLSIYRTVVDKERELRMNKKGTFRRVAHDKWNHKSYKGWINLSNAPGHIFFAKVQSKNKQEEDRLLQAFIGFLTRHSTELIDSLTVYYKEPAAKQGHAKSKKKRKK